MSDDLEALEAIADTTRLMGDTDILDGRRRPRPAQKHHLIAATKRGAMQIHKSVPGGADPRRADVRLRKFSWEEGGASRDHALNASGSDLSEPGKDGE